MYGLLIESIAEYILEEFGADAWETIRQKSGFQQSTVTSHLIYGENVLGDLAKTTSSVTGVPIENLMDSFGVFFVRFVGQFGFDRILKVLGRHMRDFLNGLDNLHEYLRFSYPKMKPPSFFCESENKNGLTLHYRSKRIGFLHYTKGQIREVGRLFYNTNIDIYVVSEEVINDTSHVVFKLLFDNKAFSDSRTLLFDDLIQDIPLHSDSLFELFPFHIVFTRCMEIKNVGNGLEAAMPNLLNTKLSQQFNVSRPLVEFTWDGILAHSNNVFVIDSKKKIHNKFTREFAEENHAESDVYFHLKGQMVYILEWDAIIFLATPVMSSLDDMFEAGLYINDLSMHDSSRDLVLAGTQQSAELKLSLDQEQEKSRLLEQSMQLLDVEMKRTDALLYQMIPKSVADRLRKGEPSVSTCEVFENVTILFSDVVGFTTICSRISPMEVVCLLNALYTKFDQLSEKHNVYKVETIGDAYMGVSGAPIVNTRHAVYVSNMALDMVSSIKHLIDPSTGGNMQIRIGIHSGTVVAGVVGIKMPRYCLFGETVNTASQMETTGEAMKIHVSEVTKRELENYPYSCEPRGSIDVKGKESMRTYWLRWNGQSSDVSTYSPTDDCSETLNHLPSTENSSLSLEDARKSDVRSTRHMDTLSANSSKSDSKSSTSSVSSGINSTEAEQKYETPLKTKTEIAKKDHFILPTNTDESFPESHVHAISPITGKSKTCCIL